MLILLASLVFVGSAYAKETYGDLTVTKLVEVYDGDTFYEVMAQISKTLE